MHIENSKKYCKYSSVIRKKKIKCLHAFNILLLLVIRLLLPPEPRKQITSSVLSHVLVLPYLYLLM